MKPGKILLFVNILLVGLAALAGARLVEGLFLFRPGEVRQEGSTERGESQRKANLTASEKQGDAGLIISRDIFGTGRSDQAVPGRAEEHLRPTSLGLLLKGTVMGENHGSFAVITDRNTNLQEVYGVNDFVQGARVVEILKDRVILSVKGSREALLMADEMEQPPSKTLAKTTPRPRSPAKGAAGERRTPPRAPVNRPSS